MKLYSVSYKLKATSFNVSSIEPLSYIDRQQNEKKIEVKIAPTHCCHFPHNHFSGKVLYFSLSFIGNYNEKVKFLAPYLLC